MVAPHRDCPSPSYPPPSCGAPEGGKTRIPRLPDGYETHKRRRRRGNGRYASYLLIAVFALGLAAGWALRGGVG